MTLVRYKKSKTWTTVTVDYFEGVMVYLESTLPRGDNNVEITYTK